MADQFDEFLAAALAPADRAPDRQFVAQVQARIALEQRLAAEQQSLLASLMKQLLAVMALAGAAWLISRSGAVAGWVAESPGAALAVLLALFMFVVAVLSVRPRAFRDPLTVL